MYWSSIFSRKCRNFYWNREGSWPLVRSTNQTYFSYLKLHMCFLLHFQHDQLTVPWPGLSCLGCSGSNLVHKKVPHTGINLLKRFTSLRVSDSSNPQNEKRLSYGKQKKMLYNPGSRLWGRSVYIWRGVLGGHRRPAIGQSGKLSTL